MAATGSILYSAFSLVPLPEQILVSYGTKSRSAKAIRVNIQRRPRVWRILSSINPSKNASDSPAEFFKKIERAWLISKQPRPVCCSSCDAKGSVECKWCKGTGFFIIGDKLLCEVPSQNSTCVICGGEGLVKCSDCKGTGFRAKWLEQTELKPADT
eukprot:TRINITY_DN5444_c0_g2_i1.p1 TRINITY_DN5444_c0_g2~~TRINITY_DN5444_c0_g2_i1.p1  ORF type:complete len:156 (-),score=10.73 TRINITY_DN5444_c0_g2_i1:461-928(-)